MTSGGTGRRGIIYPEVLSEAPDVSDLFGAAGMQWMTKLQNCAT